MIGACLGIPQLLQPSSEAVNEYMQNNDSAPITKDTSPPSIAATDTILFNKKKANFKQVEDELLVKCYWFVSQDPLVGNDQHFDLFWKHIHEKFVENNTIKAGHNQKSLVNHCSFI